MDKGDVGVTLTIFVVCAIVIGYIHHTYTTPGVTDKCTGDYVHREEPGCMDIHFTELLGSNYNYDFRDRTELEGFIIFQKVTWVTDGVPHFGSFIYDRQNNTMQQVNSWGVK